MQRLIRNIAIVGLFFFSFANAFASGDPIQMLESLANRTLSQIKEQKAEISKNKQVLNNILESTVIPYVDFNEMALWIAGKRAWNSASDVEKSKFIKEFKTLVLRTYSHFLISVSDEELTFKPASRMNGKRLQVSGTIRKSNGEIIDIDYRLVDVGSWKIYDIVVQGVSLLKGFQAQFSDRIRKEGLSSVIREIEEHNNAKG